MTIDDDSRREPKATLQGMEVHDVWSRQFRSGENAPFYALAFDYIGAVFGAPGDEPVLDAGCGSGTKSVELALRGYRVKALDFSTAILQQARATVIDRGVSDRVHLSQGDLTALSIPTASVRYAVCWGVLMHVPDVSKAVAELSRVIAPGGILVVSEGNMHSLQAVALRWLKRLLRRERAEVVSTPAGIEFWEETGAGRLMTRQADIAWLVAEFKRHGLSLAKRRAGQFSEIYVLLSSKTLRAFVHAFNNFWFRWIRVGGPAFGNILVLERSRPTGNSRSA